MQWPVRAAARLVSRRAARRGQPCGSAQFVQQDQPAAAGCPQNPPSVLECNEGKIRRGRRAGVARNPTRRVIFSQPARISGGPAPRGASGCRTPQAASFIGRKPTPRLNAAAARHCQAIAPYARQRAAHASEEDRRGGRSRGALRQMCVNGDVGRLQAAMG